MIILTGNEFLSVGKQFLTTELHIFLFLEKYLISDLAFTFRREKSFVFESFFKMRLHLLSDMSIMRSDSNINSDFITDSMQSEDLALMFSFH